MSIIEIAWRGVCAALRCGVAQAEFREGFVTPNGRKNWHLRSSFGRQKTHLSETSVRRFRGNAQEPARQIAL